MRRHLERTRDWSSVRKRAGVVRRKTQWLLMMISWQVRGATGQGNNGVSIYCLAVGKNLPKKGLRCKVCCVRGVERNASKLAASSCVDGAAFLGSQHGIGTGTPGPFQCQWSISVLKLELKAHFLLVTEASTSGHFQDPAEVCVGCRNHLLGQRIQMEINSRDAAVQKHRRY